MQRNVGLMQIVILNPDDVQNVWHNWDNSDVEEE
jgi:hypothetical protein